MSVDLSQWNADEALDSFREKMAAADTPEAQTELRNAYLSKKRGLVAELLSGLRAAPPELKPKLGKEINRFKTEVEAALKEAGAKSAKRRGPALDLTLPGATPAIGSLHPLTLTRNAMLDFFFKMGYDVSDGPEIETVYYNFTALNTPEGHPARADADTFYVDDDRLLRTQTSGCQARYMEIRKPPFRMVAPGKTYRRDDDLTHSPMFHQVEGLVVGEGIHFGHLKGTLEAFAKHMFGDRAAIRLRPSYFPFTEPSAEVDISCIFCESGCRVCKKTGWIEILGSGMVDPHVLEMAGVDSEKFTGFAFGIGIERVAMLQFGVPDIRYFFNNDRRFLDQFKAG